LETDYRKTLNLPNTAFPMRGDLPKREPERVAWWREQGVYERRLAANRGNPGWTLHDGPPYANGDLHMGHFLNRVLKDTFVKYHLLRGEYARFVPGWDMHGLPIEFETLKHLGLDFRSVDPIELREKCRERALYWLDRQRTAMLRMGLLGDYAHPYRTVDKSFEAVIVDALGDLANAGQLYRGLRATLWCVHDETALAEAEIEYRDRVSPSVYVRFAADARQREDILRRFGASGDLPAKLSAVIWTTTPWTLPANVAIALKADARYGLYRSGDELYVVAAELEAQVRAKGGLAQSTLVAELPGSALVGAFVRHPFMERDSEIVSAEYVELETGTGLVHTAPGHGAEDFDTGVRFGLPILNPVDASGRFTAEAGPYAGLEIFAANAKIVEDLRAGGALLAAESYDHSYPHCWRCKNPVIFRATQQWFIAMDVNHLRKRAGDAVATVRWTPAWGANRMEQMIENHPEWCISRQRTWGTPIPALVCSACGESFIDPDVARIVAERFRRDGANVWWSEPAAAFVPPNLACPRCGGRSFERGRDIVDIWFESGVTHLAVLGKDGLNRPADLYLEGGDQFRGWFRSSLLTSVAIKHAAPYTNVLATGWVVDAEGRAMHKSTGNYIGAQDAMQKWGADVLRLWLASGEFTSDIRVGDTVLDSVGKVYRNVRNRLRMLLGLLDDFEPSEAVPLPELAALDRLAVAAADRLARDVTAAFDAFNLHDAYLAIVAFDAEDLSSFYIDVLKDPMYSGARAGRRRRSAQTALLYLLRTLVTLLAPILSFTAEEVWQYLPERLRAGEASVFDLPWPLRGDPGPQAQRDLALWETLKRLRATVAAAEGMRDFQLQARVTVPPAEEHGFLELGDQLREALVVSAAALEIDPAVSAPAIALSPAEGGKCARCWKYLPLGSDPAHSELCAPCAAIVRSQGQTDGAVN
jgi:isoleucyl-tRNA synthetase